MRDGMDSLLRLFADAPLACESPLGPAACNDGSVMDPRRWFCRYSSGTRGVVGDVREDAVVGAEDLFWPSVAEWADADSGALAPVCATAALSIVCEVAVAVERGEEQDSGRCLVGSRL